MIKERIKKEREKMTKMILDGAKYEDILKQSQILDKYVVEFYKCGNKE